MDVLTTPFLTGTATGAILLLAALGLTLTFGQMGVINMANGEFLMVGAYVAYVTQQVISGTGLSIVVALPMAFVVAGLLGLLLEVSVIQWMYKRPLDTLLATVGVSLVLQQLAQDVFGAQGDPVTAPSWLGGRISVFGYEWPHRQLFTIVLALGALGALSAVLKYSSFGRQIRATVQNRELAETLGVSTRNVDRITFFLGLGPGRCRRRRHRADLGHEPDARHGLHHPGLPRRRRRRRRAAQGNGARRVGRRRGHRLPDRLDQRQHGAGHHLRPRGGLPHDPATGSLHRSDEVAGMTTTAAESAAEPDVEDVAGVRRRSARRTCRWPAAQHLRSVDRHRRPGIRAAGVGSRFAQHRSGSATSGSTARWPSRRWASVSPGVVAACSSWARACSSVSAPMRWPCT